MYSIDSSVFFIFYLCIFSSVHFLQVGWVRDNIPPTCGMLSLFAEFGIRNYLANGQEESGRIVSDGNI